MKRPLYPHTLTGLAVDRIKDFKKHIYPGVLILHELHTKRQAFVTCGVALEGKVFENPGSQARNNIYVREVYHVIAYCYINVLFIDMFVVLMEVFQGFWRKITN